MSGKQPHRHGRDSRDSRDGDHKRRHGSVHGKDGSRDSRDRDSRSSHHRDGPDSRQYDPRDGRPGQSHTTPPKPPGPSRGGAAAGRGGPVLGSSAFSSAILEAAKRRAAQEAAQAADDGDDPGEAGPRKKPKHEPIVWQSPRRQSAEAGGDDRSQPESLQERLQREAAEFRQRQHQLAPADGAGRPHSSRGHHHRHHSRGRSPSSSEEEPHSPGRGRSRGRGHSRSSSSRSRSSRSRSGSPAEGRRKKPAGGRWQVEEEEDEQAQQQQQQQQKPAAKSRWFDDDEAEEGEAAGEMEEGEAPAGPASVSAAVDEELEALNRRERAELEAAGSHNSSSEQGIGALSDGEEEEEQPFQKNMLEESRRVEEYERLNRISEGTYGVVHRARCKSTGAIYALKKLKLEQCPDGFPQTSVREMNVLLSLHHPNIVNVSEVVIGARDAVYMVMEYVEHDLKYVLELQHAKKAPPFSIGQIKCLMQQLLEGVAYLHEHWVIHRDLKTSNLLYSNNGQLKICDFGLARQYGSPLRAFTPAVVTLWYRSIERLLGDPVYSTALDMWSVGCILGELITGEPLFQGRGEIDQIKKIFALLGTPTQEDWPGWDQLPDAKNLQFKPQESQLRKKFPVNFFGGTQPVLNDVGFDLLSRLLEMNPAKRITAKEALEHRWFSDAPRPVNYALMPSFPQRHMQGSDAGFRDKLGNPSPGAVAVAGFGL